MNILAVDDQSTALLHLSELISRVAPNARLCYFSSGRQVLEYLGVSDFQPDVAFLDVLMPDMTGLELAGILRMIFPHINVVFISAHAQYAIEAMALRASGYLQKPATEQAILTELENLRHPVALSPCKQIRVQCFGSFEVFVDQTPVAFTRAKSKELLAYLVDRRGARSTAAEVAAILWEDGVYDRSRQKQFSVIRLEMLKSLKQAGAEAILFKSRDALAVNVEAFECDYYLALDGNVESIGTFMGEYMMPYAWAEFTTASLVSRFGEEFV